MDSAAKHPSALAAAPHAAGQRHHHHDEPSPSASPSPQGGGHTRGPAVPAWRDLDLVSHRHGASPASLLPPQGAACAFVFEPLGGHDLFYCRSTSPNAPSRGGGGGGPSSTSVNAATSGRSPTAAAPTAASPVLPPTDSRRPETL